MDTRNETMMVSPERWSRPTLKRLFGRARSLLLTGRRINRTSAILVQKTDFVGNCFLEPSYHNRVHSTKPRADGIAAAPLLATA